MHINELPHQPGDIVRDRKTGVDYVIQSVAGMAIGGGYVIYAIDVLSGRINSWIANSPTEMLDHATLIRKGNGDSPERVLEQVHERLEGAIGRNREALEKLGDPENQIFRDLLMITTEDSDQQTIERRFVDLAQTLIDITKQVPSRETIRSILKSSVNDDRITDDYIDIVATKFSQQAQNIARVKGITKGLQDQKALAEALLSRDGSLGGDLSIFTKLGFRGKTNQLESNIADPVTANMARKLLGGDLLAGHHLRGLKGYEELGKNTNAEQRIEAIFGKMIESKGGQHGVLSQQFIRRNSARLSRLARSRKQDPVLKSILDFLDEDGVTARFKHAENLNKQINAPYSELSGTYARKTAIGRKASRSAMRPHVDLNEAVRGIDETQTALSLDVPTFFDNLLHGATVKIHGQEGPISRASIKKSLIKELGKDGKMPDNLVLQAKHIRRILEDKGAGKVVDMDHYIPFIKQATTKMRMTDPLSGQVLAMHGRKVADGKLLNDGSPIVFLKDLTGNAFADPRPSPFTNSNLDEADQVLHALNLKETKEGMKRIFIASDDSDQLFASSNIKQLSEHIEKTNPDTKFVPEDSRMKSFMYVDLPQAEAAQYEIVNRLKNNQTLTKDAHSVLDGSMKTAGYQLRTVSGLRRALIDNDVTDIGTRDIAVSASKPNLYATSYKKGFDSMRTAVAQIRQGDQNIVHKIVGSEIDVPIEEQMARARSFFNEGGAILDIETHYDDPFAATTKIRQLALGVNENGKFKKLLHYSDKSLKTPKQRAKALIEVAEQLKSIKVIGTQGQYDFVQLIEQAQALKAKVPELAIGLEQAAAVFEATQEGKLFDIQVFYQLSGYDLGSTSQAAITLDLFHGKKIEQHTALQDIKDAHEIMTKLQSRFDTNTVGINFTRGQDIAKHGVLFYDDNTLSPTAGQVRQLVDMRHVTNSGGKESVVGVFQDYNSVLKDGKYELQPTKRFYQQEAGSASEFGAMLQKYGRNVTPETWNTVPVGGTKTFAEMRQERLLDASGRYLRSLNPTTKTYWDELGEFSAFGQEKLGSFSAFKAQVGKSIDEIIPSAEAEFEKLQHHYSKKLGKELGHLEAGITSLNINEAVRRAMKDKNYNPTLAAYVEDTAKEILHGGYMKNIWLDTATSDFAKFRKGVLGRALTKAAGSNEDQLYMIMHSEIMRAAAENHFTRDTKSAPRMSLELGMEKASMQLGHVDQATRIGTTMDNLAAETLFTLANEGKDGTIHSLLNQANLNPQEVIDAAQSFQDKLGIKSNLPAWKEAVHKIGMSDFESAPEFAILGQARKAIVNSSAMQTAIMDEIRTKMESFMQLDSVEKETQGAKMVSFGETLLGKLGKAFEKGDSKEAATKVFHEMYGPDFRDFFTEHFKTIDVEELNKWAEGNVADVVKRSREKFQILAGTREVNGNLIGNPELLHTAMEQAIHEVRNARTNGITGEDLLALPSRTLDNIIEQHTQGLEVMSAIKANELPATQAKIMHTTINAMKAAEGGVTKDPIREIQHRLLLTEGSPIKENFAKLTVPLLAVGGVVGLLAGVTPQDDSFSQGNISDKFSGLGMESAVSKYSEIPGTAILPRVWHGETAPFQLDITFSGFVASKEHQSHLQREVFNVISNHLEVRKTDGEVQDNRNRQHRQVAVDALRRNL